MEDDASAQEQAGLHLMHLWRCIDSSGHTLVYFVMEVKDIDGANIDRAREYFASALNNWIKKHAVIHSYEWHFTEAIALPAA